MNKLIKTVSFLFLSLLIVLGCGPAWEPQSTCPGSTLECGDVCCPDSTHYACVSGQCKLAACDNGYYFCAHSCIPLNSVCCSQSTGSYCVAQQCCPSISGFSCSPLGSTCCGLTGRYCPFGRGCNANGTLCY